VSVAVAISTLEPKDIGKRALRNTPPAVLKVDYFAQPPDLTIEITDPTRNRRALNYRVLSPHLQNNGLGDPGVWHLPDETRSLVAGFLAEFVKPGVPAQARLLSLRGAGRQLWQIVPGPVKDIFWRLLDADKLKTIFINSEEPYIPWELMIPTRYKNGELKQRHPLGAEFAIGRWIPGDHTSPVQAIPLTRSLVIAPSYKGPKPKPLAHASTEADYVRSKIPGESMTPVTFVSVVKELFAEVDLIHFVCHGAESKSFGIQSMFLEDGELTSIQLDGMCDPEKKLHGRLVFLNACEVGRPQPALTGVGGFTKSFIDLGAVAVIAPLWSVKDNIAHEVACTFYDNVSLKPLASILREIRSKAYSDAGGGEDTYAAYCFYGDPAAF
jgi:hypothetical protein